MARKRKYDLSPEEQEDYKKLRGTYYGDYKAPKAKAARRPLKGPQNPEKVKQQRAVSASENRIAQLPGEKPATKSDTTLVRKFNKKFFDDEDVPKPGKKQDPLARIKWLDGFIDGKIEMIGDEADATPGQAATLETARTERDSLETSLVKPPGPDLTSYSPDAFNLVERHLDERPVMSRKSKEAKKRTFLEGL